MTCVKCRKHWFIVWEEDPGPPSPVFNIPSIDTQEKAVERASRPSNWMQAGGQSEHAFVHQALESQATSVIRMDALSEVYIGLANELTEQHIDEAPYGWATSYVDETFNAKCNGCGQEISKDAISLMIVAGSDRASDLLGDGAMFLGDNVASAADINVKVSFEPPSKRRLKKLRRQRREQDASESTDDEEEIRLLEQEAEARKLEFKRQQEAERQAQEEKSQQREEQASEPFEGYWADDAANQLLQKAEATIEAGDKKQARVMLRQVLDEFPDSDAAKIVRKKYGREKKAK